MFKEFIKNIRHIQCFCIWSAARNKEKEIIQLIRDNFIILKIYEVNWTKEKFGKNLSAFYADDFCNNPYQLEMRGDGEFIFIITENLTPILEKRKGNRGEVIVDPKSFDLKKRVRAILGTSSFHATNDEKEARRAVALITHKSLDDFLLTETLDGKIEKLFQDTPGVNGWKNLKDFFYVLNECCNYCVLRTFESLPDTHTYEKNGDIDLLIDDMQAFLSILRPASGVDVNAFKFFNWENMGVDNPSLLFHPKFVGDNYYPIGMQKAILETRVLNDKGIYVPSDELYFWSLLYHGLFHKENFIKYSKIFHKLAKKLNIDYQDNKEYLTPLLCKYLKSNGFTGIKKHLDLRSGRLLVDNINDKSLLNTKPKFYQYLHKANHTLLVFEEKAISINPELVTSLVKPLDLFVDLERHVLSSKSKLYAILLKRLKKSEIIWKFSNRYDDIMVLSYIWTPEEHYFSKRLLSGNKCIIGQNVTYKSEEYIDYINGQLYSNFLKQLYVKQGEEALLEHILRFINYIFERFKIEMLNKDLKSKATNDMLLSGKAWDMLPKNCFYIGDTFVLFDFEATFNHTISKQNAVFNIIQNIYIILGKNAEKQFSAYNTICITLGLLSNREEFDQFSIERKNIVNSVMHAQKRNFKLIDHEYTYIYTKIINSQKKYGLLLCLIKICKKTYFLVYSVLKIRRK